MRRAARRLGFACAYAAYLAVFVVGLDYALYRGFLAEVRDAPNAPESDELETGPHVDRALVQRLGSVLHVRQEKRSAFTRFPRAKREGVVRICAFGDSFTFGNEVDGEHDYPTLLQRAFDRHGFARVEVLNFGNGGYGFHQSHLLWESVGAGFACDFVLLGPSGFQAQRDTTFNHLQDRAPYYVHARYVLDGDDVRLVEPLGATHEERFSHYFRFVPHARYLRYDRIAPAFLQSLVRRDDWEMANPFYYYDGEIEQEAHETYRILLAKMARSGAQLVLGHYWDEIVEVGLEVPADNLAVVPLYRPRTFPYVAPKGHNSAWGNALLAGLFLDQLVDAPIPPLEVLELRDPEPPGGACPDPPAPLAQFDSAAVVAGGAVVGHFAIAEGFRGWGHGSPQSLRRRKIVSLLALVAPGQRVVDGLFVPLATPLGEDTRVVLELSGEGPEREVSLGPVRLLHPCANIGVLAITGLKRNELAGSDAIPAARLAKAARLRLLVDGRPVLEGRGGGPVELRPPGRGRLWKLTPTPSAPASVEATGVFELRLARRGAIPLRVPLAAWTKVPAELPVARRALARRITPAPGGGG